MASIQTPSTGTANVTTEPVTAVTQDVGACDIQPDLENLLVNVLAMEQIPGASDTCFQKHGQEV